MNSYLFISQLIRNEICFSPVILLEDPTEGQLKNYSFFDKVVFGGKYKIRAEKEREIIKSNIESEFQKYHVSCWTINQNEDYALWNIFTDKLTGIIIKSTEEKFLTSIEDSRNMLHEEVKYIPQNRRFTVESYSSVKERIFTKFDFYSYEKEYRFAYKIETVLNQNTNSMKYLSIPTDFSSLIINIVLSPFMSVMNKRYFRDTINILYPKLSSRIIDSSIKLKKNTI